MSRLQLNKSSLAAQSKNLTTYRRFLPSLDLKRQQLMAERNTARAELAQVKAEIDTLEEKIAHGLPMLGNSDMSLENMVSLKQAEVLSENVVGTHLPKLGRVDFDVTPYSVWEMPHWVDEVVVFLKQRLELELKKQVAQKRVTLLDKAVRTMTQRVNLFEKVLIPQTQTNIKRIKIYLSDEQMAAVVRSKIAKRKRSQVANS